VFEYSAGGCPKTFLGGAAGFHFRHRVLLFLIY
jgi:hypothetical protein